MSGEMRLPTLLRRRGAPTEIGGVIRLDRRTKDLTKRLRPGEIAIIHHTDLDRVSAEALVKTGVSAVVNAVPSVSGRYPNLGPGILMDAGIVLIDDVGEAIFNLAHEGERVSLDGGKIYRAARDARSPRASSTPRRSSRNSSSTRGRAWPTRSRPLPRTP